MLVYLIAECVHRYTQTSLVNETKEFFENQLMKKPTRFLITNTSQLKQIKTGNMRSHHKPIKGICYVSLFHCEDIERVCFHFQHRIHHRDKYPQASLVNETKEVY